MRDCSSFEGNPGTPEERDQGGNDQEKRLRREIANSNERRRMQSINAGFQSLRNLLPQHEGEKLSKAAILQQTADYISQLQQEKVRLMNQNSQLLKRYSNNDGRGNSSESTTSKNRGNATSTCSQPGVYSSPQSPCTGDTLPGIIKRRKTLDGSVESADEGIGSMSPDHNGEEYRNELSELRRETLSLRMQLERERQHRLSLEDTLSSLQGQRSGSEEQRQPRIVLSMRESKEEENTREVLAHHQQTQQRVAFVQHSNELLPNSVQTLQIKQEKAYEENEVHLRAPSPVESPREDCRVRHNLNSIVEAIRQLEGDHLFADDAAPEISSVSTNKPVALAVSRPVEKAPTTALPPTLMMQNHHGSTITVHHPTTLTYQHPEIHFTQASIVPSVEKEAGHNSESLVLPVPVTFFQPPPSCVSVSTPVTSLKHHLLSRLARSGELEEPVNLEYRRVPPNATPYASNYMQQETIKQNHSVGIVNQSVISADSHHAQQQRRPGVIVVKHA